MVLKEVMQFRVELLGVAPAVWRRIQVPADYTLWDLHVAIQDSMGWLDYHLHVFRVVGSQRAFGIPDEDGEDPLKAVPGWKFRAQDVFSDRDPVGTYEYDFGDSWVHVLTFEGFERAEVGARYPRCLDGARRCPPEDCGGTSGYAELLRVLEDSSHPDHESTLTWVGGSFDPAVFSPDSIHFDDPEQRWTLAFATAEE